MRTIMRLTLIVTMLVITSSAHAEERGYSRFGFYAGGGYTYAGHLFEDELNEALPIDIAIDNASGFHIRGGIRLLPFLAIEGEYERVSSFIARAVDTPIGGDLEVLDLKGDVLTGNLKLIIPTWWLQPYALVGIGNAKYTIEDPLGFGLGVTRNAFAGRVAGGVDLYVSDAIVLYGEFGAVLTTHDIDNPTTTESISGLHYLATKFGMQVRF